MPILTDQERCGTLIGEVYRLESILGRGGMGVVFRARDEARLRPVAVKILRPELAMQNATFAKRFVREARAAAAVKHPNVVEVYDVGTEPDGTAFQVLALLEGETLRDHLTRKGKLSVHAALEILLPVMHALEAAHAASIVHRDLKPDNIFLARQPNGDVLPTLLDFGIAKLLEGHESFATNTGSILGTPSYMAPEQATGAREQGLGIDVWAMGIILYECLAGAPPFTGTSPPHVMLKIMTEDPAQLDVLVPSVPRAIAQVVSQALMRSLRERYPSMHAFREALRAAARESDVAIPEEGRSSTTTMMSVAPPPQKAEDLELSVALDSAVRPRVEPDAPTLAASVAAPLPSAAQAEPVVIAPTLPTKTAETPPRGRMWAAAVAVLTAGVVAVAWVAQSSSSRSVDAPPAPPAVAAQAAPSVTSDVLGTETQATPVTPDPSPPVAAVVDPATETAEPATEPTAEPAATPQPARPGRTPRPRRTTETPPREDPPPTMEVPTPRNGLPGVVAW